MCQKDSEADLSAPSATVMALHQHGESLCRSIPELRSLSKVTASSRESGWRTTEDKRPVLRITNSIRRKRCGEPARIRRSLKYTCHVERVLKTMTGHDTWLEAEWSEGERGKRGYLLVKVTMGSLIVLQIGEGYDRKMLRIQYAG